MNSSGDDNNCVGGCGGGCVGDGDHGRGDGGFVVDGDLLVPLQ